MDSVTSAVERAERHGWKVVEWYLGGCVLWHRCTGWGVRVIDDCGRVVIERV